MWKCYSKECGFFQKGYNNNCVDVIEPCDKAILKQPQDSPKPFINLKEATIEDLSVIILDPSFEYWFRKDALKEYDRRF